MPAPLSQHSPIRHTAPPQPRPPNLLPEANALSSALPIVLPVPATLHRSNRARTIWYRRRSPHIPPLAFSFVVAHAFLEEQDEGHVVGRRIRRARSVRT